ncbi:hypothetical protein UFOVP787_104 [uncultured Caudovirales phage]|uniref:Peptidase M15B n=1 Tax=uncultured Caudovirales phage TaxID=2100421 RepID=A0A6J5P0N8_9CAUD|nr:hypothetical protein UFOVP787_104 [uncultured Caudovirales phage]
MAKEDVRQLSEVTRNTNTVVTQFRQASNDNTKNMSKIVKDISSVFKGQRSEISSLNSTIDENINATNRTAAKVDQTNNLMQETVNIQNRMLSELKNLARTVKEGNISQKEENVSWLGKIYNALTGTTAKVIGGVAAAGYAGKEIASYDPKNPKLPSDSLPSERGNSSRGAGGKNAPSSVFESIIKAEGTNKYNDPYNTSLGYEKSPKPLTEMTMKEVLDWGDYIRKQTKVGKNHNSSAKGAFQIVNTTQKEAMKALGIGMDEKFNEENQRRLASWILQKQGFGAWEGFKKHPEELKKAQEALKSASSQTNQNTNSDGRKLENFNKELFSLGGGRTGNLENVEKLNPDLKQALLGALEEYKNATGKTATITSGARSREDQEAISSPYMKAKPGTSKHERGSAVDLNSADAREMERLGILKKYGLHRPHGEKDPVHVELKSPGQQYNQPKPGSSRGMGAEPIPAEATGRSSPFMNMDPRSIMPSFPGMGPRSEASPFSVLSNVLGNIPQLGTAGSIIGPIASILGNLTSKNIEPPLPYNKNIAPDITPKADVSPSIGTLLEKMKEDKTIKETGTQPNIIMASSQFGGTSADWSKEILTYFGVNPQQSSIG